MNFRRLGRPYNFFSMGPRRLFAGRKVDLCVSLVPGVTRENNREPATVSF